MADVRSEVTVWDIFVRTFHWSLVAAFTVAYVSGDEFETAHLLAGYIVAALICLRAAWGCVGTRYARFGQFVKSPAAVAGYVGDIAAGREKRYLGHNPAGGAMIVALLLSLAALSVTGWLMTTDTFWGSSWLEDAHQVVANLTIILIICHVLGVAVASFRHRENLVFSMLTGKKRAPGNDDMP